MVLVHFFICMLGCVGSIDNIKRAFNTISGILASLWGRKMGEKKRGREKGLFKSGFVGGSFRLCESPCADVSDQKALGSRCLERRIRRLDWCGMSVGDTYLVAVSHFKERTIIIIYEPCCVRDVGSLNEGLGQTMLTDGG